MTTSLKQSSGLLTEFAGRPGLANAAGRLAVCVCCQKNKPGESRKSLTDIQVHTVQGRDRHL